ncbi:MAG: 4-hydroxy-3-methylbut-2-enyl diphosphate reductase [Treponema sp.]|nr:4-hydroxy-3-methylbut-2-enyl diphosphate reductase [Treponema sp.]
MEIIKAQILGYCFGVRRAVEKAEQALVENSDCPVYSLGPLIHNKTTLNRLASSGMKTAENISEIPSGAAVIIRAHGVPPQVIFELEEKNCRIIDATCPRVKASQKIAEKNRENLIVFTGDAEHGEVKGISGYGGKNFRLIQNLEDAQNLSEKNESIYFEKTVLFSQTTFSEKEFDKIKKVLDGRFSNLEVLNTICPATKERQDSLLELCKKVDGVVVIGGKQSANTIRLFQTARENCGNAVHIEKASELPEEFFKLDKIGITAGASTPDEIINEVCEVLNVRSSR